ncbi:sigma-70 family RNA polymerase sigma factor [Streptomyces sp. NPDC127049]|uniref:sigma-70 family RNA polymerase sigma factor n=1 Tax=Streptomyces sp. NPDC127049 TaxID=3347118 RepID=UPI0036589DC8
MAPQRPHHPHRSESFSGRSGGWKADRHARRRLRGSLDAPVIGSDDERAPKGTEGRHIALEEPGYELIDELQSLRPLLDQLGERDRKILSLRFGEELTQSETGDRVGLSQMHVSRQLTRILATLHEGLLADRIAEDSTDVEGQ